MFNTLRLRRNRHHFADDIFERIFFNENVWISIKIPLKFVFKVSINNISALVQIMAWRRPGGKPLSESMMVSLPTHICVTRPLSVKFNLHVGLKTMVDIREYAKQTFHEGPLSRDRYVRSAVGESSFWCVFCEMKIYMYIHKFNGPIRISYISTIVFPL